MKQNNTWRLGQTPPPPEGRQEEDSNSFVYIQNIFRWTAHKSYNAGPAK